MYKILICIFLPFGALAQNSYTAILDSFMQAQVLVKKFNGNVLVAKRGEIIYEKSFGYSNYDENQLLDDNSMFEVASVSKQFTAMAILLLKEGGKL